MAKRFTDTEMWDKEWYMNLSLTEKLLTRLVRDKCDVAGIYTPNMALLSTYLGVKVTIDDILNIDGGNQFIKLQNGKIYCAGFIEFQYGNNLNPKSKVHAKVLTILETNNIEDFAHIEDNYVKYSNDYYMESCRVLHTLQDKDKDKDKEEDKEKDKDKDKEEDKEKEKDEKKNSKIQKLATHQEMGEEYKKWFYDKKMVDPKISNVDYTKLSEIKKEIIRQIRINGRDATESEVLEGWKIILSACELDDFIFNKSEANLKVIASSLNKIFALIMRQKSGTAANSKIEKGVENITLKDVRLRSSF